MLQLVEELYEVVAPPFWVSATNKCVDEDSYTVQRLLVPRRVSVRFVLERLLRSPRAVDGVAQLRNEGVVGPVLYEVTVLRCILIYLIRELPITSVIICLVVLHTWIIKVRINHIGQIVKVGEY